MEDPVEKVLAHYGVKGMRWGVRKRRDTGDSSSGPPSGHTVVKVKASPGKSPKTSGGQGVDIHPDAVRAVVNKQIARASGVHALPNDELKALVTRMQLEQNYQQLMAKQPKTLKQKAINLILDKGQEEIVTLAKGDVGPIAKNLDAILASRSTGRHVIRPVGIVAPATGRHRK